MSFENWIKSKIKEDSSFGDLARDYKSACQIDLLNGRDIEPLNKEHLYRWNATEGAHNALVKAIKQYEKELINGVRHTT